MPRLCRLLPVLLAALVAGAPSAQVGFSFFNGRNHPELDWQVATTEHFEIIYPARLAGIEAEAAAVAEATYDALTRNFSADSTAITFDDPIRIYLSDEDEIANGIAYNVGGSGFTTIWVHVNETAEIWTGDVKWLRKVIAHEVAHLVHYRAVRSNLGLLDVFFADPFPSFWTEGLAQYQTERWDAQRGDRWLRTATFEDRLSYTDGSSPQNGRLRYAVGNSQVRYLAQSRGDSTLAKILAHRTPVLLGLGRVHDFRTAFESVTGESYATFNEEWRKHVNVYYNTQAGQMERLDSLDAEPFGLPGQVVYDVSFSPDTMWVAGVVLPSLRRPVRRLIVVDNPGADSTRARELRILAEGSINGPVDWSPDGRRIAFARTRRGAYGSLLNDLYLVDAEGGNLRRLTTDRRAVSPTFAPDGRRLAFVGTDGTTANLFTLDLETGAERPLTSYTGDVQITTARWSPDGGRIAFALFDEDGRRDLAVLDVATGEVARLGTAPEVDRAERDDRIPVWSPAGDTLAFTSLRDRAPNAFLVGDMGREARDVEEMAARPNRLPDPVGAATDSAASGARASSAGEDDAPSPSPLAPSPVGEARVTFLYDGATVHDWLPPDSLHPAGRLVLVASETKRRDRVFVVDARRRPTVVTDSVEVPEPYAAWTTHRPPRTVPDQIAPDPSLIRGRRGYNSWRNVTHAITLALPYGDPGEDGELFTADDDWGAFANSLFLEPLGKHQVALLAGVSVTRPVDKSFLLLSYVNQQFTPTLTLDLYRFPSPSSFYGSSVLVEDLTGGDVSATWTLDLLDRPYTTTLAGARLRYAYASPLALDRFDDLDDTGLGVPEAGTRFDAQVGAAYKFQRPYRWNVITPIDGTGLRARVTAGIPTLGGDAFVRPDVLGYWVSPSLGFGRLFVQGRATAIVGETLAQDYVGLARFDDVDLQAPFVGAVTLDDAERVRGYRRYAVGTRALFGSAEYRLPIVADLNTTLLGLVKLGPVSPSLFVDGGLVWTGSDLDGAARRMGVGAELANVLSLGGFELRHAVGLATPASALDELWNGERGFEDLDLYYRIQAAVPF
jgi:dipeptidyl aminopeptidase/acylaminoacyl peptidase